MSFWFSRLLRHTYRKLDTHAAASQARTGAAEAGRVGAVRASDNLCDRAWLVQNEITNAQVRDLDAFKRNDAVIRVAGIRQEDAA